MSSFEPGGFFLLRTPSLPWSSWASLPEPLLPEHAPEGAPQADPTAARRALRRRLRELVDRPDVREALFVASPSLDDSLAEWLRDPEGRRGLPIERALVFYLSRMAGRPTPMALFAGTLVGTAGRETRLPVPPTAARRRHSRVSFLHLIRRCDALARDPSLRAVTRYFPSGGGYEVAGGHRYFEATIAGALRDYTDAFCEGSEPLTRAIRAAAEGRTPREITQAICDPGDDPAEAAAFVDQLIDAGVLVSELRPALCGPEPAREVGERLAELPAGRATAHQLEAAARELAAIDRAGFGQPPARYEAARAALADGGAAGEWLQVDLVTTDDRATLGPEVAGELLRAVDLMHRLSDASTSPLAELRRSFLERYEAQEVPLVEALDDEIGLAYSAIPAATSPLLEGLAFGLTERPRTTAWGAREAALLGILQRAARDGAGEVELGDEQLRALERPAGRTALPAAFCVMATLAAASTAELDAGDFQVYVSAFNSAGALLGRLSRFDDTLRTRLAAFLEREEAERPEAVFAEVVHEPRGLLSAANVLSRPSLRRYEIPYLSRSRLPDAQQIPITDLLLSVRDDRLVLRSRRLDKEVVPRLSAAHAYWVFGHLPIYQFLCRLQNDAFPHRMSSGVTPIVEALPSAPRLRSGRVVLSLARWRIDGADIERLLGAAGRVPAIRRWREDRGLPRFVRLVEEEASLVVDLENVLQVDHVARTLERRGGAAFEELWPDGDRLPARGPEGAFRSELIVPFSRKAGAGSARREPRERSRVDAAVRERAIPPGGAWSYAKLYTGPFVMERLLLDEIAPLFRGLAREHAIDRWFFVRYQDPRWHLRVRFRGPAEGLDRAARALGERCQALLASRTLAALTYDTYQREIERYGGLAALREVEDVFCADSACALELVEASSDDLGARWRLALVGIDALLQDLLPDLSGRLEVVDRLHEVFARELGATTPFLRRVGDRFRTRQPELEPLLFSEEASAPALRRRVQGALARRSAAVAAPIGALRALDRAGQLGASFGGLAADLCHMHVNRLLRNHHRQQELVLYGYLRRLYRSRIARGEGAPR